MSRFSIKNGDTGWAAGPIFKKHEHPGVPDVLWKHGRRVSVHAKLAGRDLRGTDLRGRALLSASAASRA